MFDTLKVVFHIDTETFLPVQMEFGIEGMNELMTDYLEQNMGDLSSLGMEMEIGTISVIVNGCIYEAVEVSQVPQEALDSDADMTG